MNRIQAVHTKQAIAQRSMVYEVAALGLAFISNLLCGLTATLMSTYLPGSVQDLLGTLSAEQVSHVGSYVGSLFLVGWALGGISLGWLGDRLGRVHTFAASLLIFGVFTLAAAWSPSWQMLVAFRFLAGFGVGATMVLSAVFVAEVWGDRSRSRAVVISVVAVGFPIGIITTGVISYLLPDWRSAFMIGSLPLVLALICYLFLREPKHGKDEDKSTDGWEKSGSVKDLINPANRTNFLVGTTVFGAMSVGIWGIFTWLPAWAQNLVGSEMAGQIEGGILMILLGSGGIVGCLAAGFLANRFGRRMSLMGSFAGAFAASSVLFWTNTTFTSVIFVETAFLSLFFGVSQGILMGYIPELFPRSIRSTATGICFNVGRLGTATGVFFVGVLVTLLGGYGNALLVISLTYAIGFAVTWFGEETKDAVL